MYINQCILTVKRYHSIETEVLIHFLGSLAFPHEVNMKTTEEIPRMFAWLCGAYIASHINRIHRV